MGCHPRLAMLAFVADVGAHCDHPKGHKMKTNMQISLLLLSLLSFPVYSAEEENASTEPAPISCYKLAASTEKLTGVSLNVGQAIELCSGANDAVKVIQCFLMAFSHPENGGLGLNAGSAIRLCKQNSQNGIG